MRVDLPFQAAWSQLDAARGAYHEDPAAALAVAARWASSEHPAIRGRVLAVQGMVVLNQGRLREAFALTERAEAEAEIAGDLTTTVEVAALSAHLAFFSGSYREALQAAERSVAAADASGELALRVYARRCGCVVFGNLDVPEWPDRLAQQFALVLESGDRWEEAMTRNDRAHFLMVSGEHDEAIAEIGRALELAAGLAPRNRFALGVVTCTRAEILLAVDRAAEALEDARTAMDHLTVDGDPNPYLFGMCVRVEVLALVALGRVDRAWRDARAAMERLGESVPQARSMILQEVASALHAAGRDDRAYEALAESAELERLAFRELTELHRDFERAVVERTAARSEADTLATKNGELEATLVALAEAHRELEELQAQLREQADRDWLTGLYNRRYLAGVLERVSGTPAPDELSLAAVDLDHFKSVNDRFGHDVGDRVLARTAQLLSATVRASDVVARAGGEEFVVVMPHADAAEAAACADRLCAAIAAEPWHRLAVGLTITASIGVVTADGRTASVESLVQLADRRLYAAKRAGRNRVDAHSHAAA
jgi:diguanylate cyclase (GGDEF)-like protein